MESDNVNNSTLKRRNLTRISVNGKYIQHLEDEIRIIPVKLCYRKNHCPIGSGRFGLVSAAKISSIVSRSSSEPISCKTETIAVKTVLLRPTSLKELSILQKLSHGNIIQLLAYHKNDRELHLLFERMDLTLYDKLDHDGAFDVNDCLGLSIQLFTALDYLQDECILHRDIKPTNILLNSTCRTLKICDFGCAKEVVNLDDKLNTYMCSRFYRAPELILGMENYDFKVDIWSAGCVMAEMLCAKPLFQGSSSVDQLVEIVSLIGPMTTSDFVSMGLDESFALAEVLTKENFSPRSSSSSTFEHRFQAALSLNLEPDFLYFFAQIFNYIPHRRWDAEQCFQFLQWNL